MNDINVNISSIVTQMEMAAEMLTGYFDEDTDEVSPEEASEALYNLVLFQQELAMIWRHGGFDVDPVQVTKLESSRSFSNFRMAYELATGVDFDTHLEFLKEEAEDDDSPEAANA